jgi:hypothetical protein
MATLMAADSRLAAESDGCAPKVNVDIAVTFGSPRVGNIAFALEQYRSGPPLVRIVNSNDFIAFLPASGTDDPFSHVGTMHLFDRTFTSSSRVCVFRQHDNADECAHLRSFRSVVEEFHPNSTEEPDVPLYHLNYFQTTLGTGACGANAGTP